MVVAYTTKTIPTLLKLKTTTITCPKSVELLTVTFPQTRPKWPSHRPSQSPTHLSTTTTRGTMQSCQKSQSRLWARKRWLYSKLLLFPLALPSLPSLQFGPQRFRSTATSGLFSRSPLCRRGGYRVVPNPILRIRVGWRVSRRRLGWLTRFCTGLGRRGCMSPTLLPRYGVSWLWDSFLGVFAKWVSVFICQIWIFNVWLWIRWGFW